MAKPRINLPAVDLSDVDLQIIDVKKYDFEDLRSDVSDILSVQQAAATILKWAVPISVIGSVVTWFIFTSRMSTVALTLFMILVLLALALVAVNAGIFFVLRNRLAQTNRAAERVIELTSEVHGDYLKVRTGETELPAGALAATLTEQLIFPALTGGIMKAAMFGGPTAFALRPVLKRSLSAVEQRVLEALHNTPMPALNRGDDAPSTEVDSGPLTAELVDDLPRDVGDWYASVHDSLRRVVSGVSTVATGSMGMLLVLSTIPLLTLLAFGWLLT